MECKGTARLSPPLVHRDVFGSCFGVIRPDRKPKFDVVTWQLAYAIRQELNEIVLVFAPRLPTTIAFRSIRIDVGDDPSLILGHKRVIIWEFRQISAKAAQQSRPHGFVRVAST